MLPVKAKDILLFPAFNFITITKRLMIKTHHIWIWIAFSLSPKKYFSGKFCFSCLKKLCKALHKAFQALEIWSIVHY